MTDLLHELGLLGVVPVVKIERAEDAVALGEALLEGGCPASRSHSVRRPRGMPLARLPLPCRR